MFTLSHFATLKKNLMSSKTKTNEQTKKIQQNKTKQKNIVQIKLYTPKS